MSRYYPEDKKMTERDAEMYVQGVYDLLMMVGGDTHCKCYDPLTFEGGKAHSYVLDLQDGGRHHEYSTPDNVADMALMEFAEELMEMNENKEIRWCDYYKKKLNKDLISK